MFILSLDAPQETIRFYGGSPEAFVRMMSRPDGAPFCVFADPHERLKSPGGFIGMPKVSAPVAKEIGMTAYGSTMGFSSRKLPLGFLVRQLYSDYAESVGQEANLSMRDGKVVVPHEGSCWVRVGSLARLKLKKRLSMHWTYESAYVALSPGTFDEDLLLRTIGDALGAKTKVTGDAIDFDFEAGAHRQRAGASYADPSWAPRSLPMLRWGRSVYRSVVASLTDAEWGRAFATPSSGMVKPGLTSSSPVLGSVRQGMMEMCRDLLATDQAQAYETSVNVLRNMDSRSKSTVTVSANGRITAEVELRDGKTSVVFG